MIIFIPRISQANEEIPSNSTNEKTCEQIGMIANDASKDSLNYSLLCNELNAGTKIIVDDKYYISGAKNATAITKDVCIEGKSDNAEFSFTNTSGTSYLFDIQTTEFFMKRVKLTQLSGGFMSALYIKGSQKIENFVIDNCYFEGSIRLVEWSFEDLGYIDPSVTDYGITNFSFNYNTCKNLTHTFIILANVPIHHSSLIGNNINNFSYLFYSQGISNDNLYNKETAERMSYLEVRDNVVTCDSSWNGAPKDQTYLCFVLFEGNKCDYYHNTVEGLHVIDQSTAVYDAYLSCWDLDYQDNYWKNNISFSPSKTHADLMKSKSVNKSDYHDVKRIYKNNTFIVEKSYADIIGRPYEELWVSLGEYTSGMDTVIVENNNIDVYKLRMNSYQPIHNYTFDNNEVHVYATQETFSNCILPGSSLADPAPTDTYIARNNKIIIDTPSKSENHNTLIRVTGQQVGGNQVKVIFENNYVKWPNLDAIVSLVNGSTPIIKDVRIVNNRILWFDIQCFGGWWAPLRYQCE